MKNLRIEYKLVLILGGVFLVILTIALVKVNFFSDKLDELRSKNYIKCTETKMNNGVAYTSHYCTVKDDLNASFVISYPSIDLDGKDVEGLNKKLSSQYDSVLKSINFNKANNKFYLSNLNSLEYELYYYNDILSVLIINNKIDDETYEETIEYQVYNIDAQTGNFISNDDMKKKCGITYDTSSEIRMKVVDMYALDFGYDYIGKLSYLRDKVYDESVESITYNNLSNLYVDDEGNKHFIFWLYNPNYKGKVPYYFTIDKDGNITYELEGK